MDMGILQSAISKEDLLCEDPSVRYVPYRPSQDGFLQGELIS